MKRALTTAAAVTLLGAALASCGGGGDAGGAAFRKGGPPAPSDCIEKWNKDPGAVNFGKHAFLDHQSRAAQVSKTTEEQVGADLAGSCVVVFAVTESDDEYGGVGEVELPDRWDYITSLPSDDPQLRFELQRRAAEQANASIDSNGELAPLS